MFDLSTGIFLLLILCLLFACAFEFVNGFHDTANAVATVIYTNTLKPTIAVVWSGFCNFVGVYSGGIAVAMGIVNLLPVETLVDPNIHHGMAMIFALLLSAIIWNLGTWYVGLPASSSHALIGSILGVGIAFTFLPESGNVAVNWAKAKEMGLSLLLSPLLGFALSVTIMFVFKRLVKNEAIYKEPLPGKKPPMWIRIILFITCSLVSFFHGGNDGQKGVGLIMLILICLVPSYFSLDEKYDISETYRQLNRMNTIILTADMQRLSPDDQKIMRGIMENSVTTLNILKGRKSVEEIAPASRFLIRRNILLITSATRKLIDRGNLPLSKNDEEEVKVTIVKMKKIIEFAPPWVIIIVALSLGLGTMIGWKRIVKTVGEKIGKQHMSYAQGASAEIVAAGTIGFSTGMGLPVSTTHVLSSGIAGAMVAKKGLKNLQPATIKNILLAWVLTLPVTMVLSGGLFLLFRAIF